MKTLNNPDDPKAMHALEQLRCRARDRGIYRDGSENESFFRNLSADMVERFNIRPNGRSVPSQAHTILKNYKATLKELVPNYEAPNGRTYIPEDEIVLLASILGFQSKEDFSFYLYYPARKDEVSFDDRMVQPSEKDEIADMICEKTTWKDFTKPYHLTASLKRVFGKGGVSRSELSKEILNIVAQYITDNSSMTWDRYLNSGYEMNNSLVIHHRQSSNTTRKRILCSTLLPGNKVRMEFAGGRQIQVKCTGTQRFVVEKSYSDKLKKGNYFSAISFVVGSQACFAVDSPNGKEIYEYQTRPIEHLELIKG